MAMSSALLRAAAVSLQLLLACLGLLTVQARVILQAAAPSISQELASLMLSVNSSSVQVASAPISSLYPGLVRAGGVQTESEPSASGTASLQSFSPTTSVCQTLQDACMKDVTFALINNELDLSSTDTANCGSDVDYLIVSGGISSPRSLCIVWTGMPC